jgi:hypothetical protein
VVLRTDAPKNDGTFALVLQVYVNGQRRRTNTSVHVRPQDFDRKRQCVMGPDNSGLVKTIIHKAKSGVEKIFYEAILGHVSTFQLMSVPGPICRDGQHLRSAGQHFKDG